MNQVKERRGPNSIYHVHWLSNCSLPRNLISWPLFHFIHHALYWTWHCIVRNCLLLSTRCRLDQKRNLLHRLPYQRLLDLLGSQYVSQKLSAAYQEPHTNHYYLPRYLVPGIIHAFYIVHKVFISSWKRFGIQLVLLTCFICTHQYNDYFEDIESGGLEYQPVPTHANDSVSYGATNNAGMYMLLLHPMCLIMSCSLSLSQQNKNVVF